VVRRSHDQIESYLSAYLTGGWRKDEFILDSVEADQGRIRGLVRKKPGEIYVRGIHLKCKRPVSLRPRKQPSNNSQSGLWIYTAPRLDALA
jgi:hypothetical protein